MKTPKLTTLIVYKLVLCVSMAATTLFAQPEFQGLEDSATNPNYRLSIRDRISIAVFDEPELTHNQLIDGKGEIRVPLLGEFKVEGMTIREVERLLEQQYIEQEFLRSPIVTLDVQVYSAKEVSVLGPGIARAGQVPFPPEIEKIDIVELISMVGGFTPLANKKDVKVTRKMPDGSQTVLSINVEEKIEGRKKNRNTEIVYIYPGDLIYVREVFL